MPQQHPFVLFSVLTTLSLGPAFHAAQAQSAVTGTLRVTVRDSSGRALSTARGTLYGPTSSSSRPVETASDGSLTVSDLPFGRYTLQLAALRLCDGAHYVHHHLAGTADA